MEFSKFALFCKWMRKKLHKIEFSKLLCGIVAGIIGAVGIYSIIEYYIQMRKAIECGSTVAPDASLAITCVGTLLGAFLSYCFYQFGLKNSRNKYNVDPNGNPYEQRIKEIYDNIKNQPTDEPTENGGID